MTEMLKGVCVIVLVVCVGVMIYTILNAINTAKKNKATDEASRRIFLAQMQTSKNTNSTESSHGTQKILKQPFSFEPAKPKEINYDEFEDDVESVDLGGKGLKDFFKQ
jgi:hypothetical protein